MEDTVFCDSQVSDDSCIFDTDGEWWETEGENE
jgi:hypothetical protein